MARHAETLIRVQVQLTGRQHRKLRDLADDRGRSVAHLVREGVDRILAEDAAGDRWAGLGLAVGALKERRGSRGVARDHDRHIRDAFSV